MLKQNILKGLNILLNPQKAFVELQDSTFEDVVGYYTILLVFVSISAGIAAFFLSLAKTAYYDLFFEVNVVYSRVINYLVGRSVLLMFLYIFLGTFILFFASVALKLFFGKMKYTVLLKIMLVSLTPFLLFAWIPYAPLALLVWSIFLFYTGISNHMPTKINKRSIKNRY